MALLPLPLLGSCAPPAAAPLDNGPLRDGVVGFAGDLEWTDENAEAEQCIGATHVVGTLAAEAVCPDCDFAFTIESTVDVTQDDGDCAPAPLASWFDDPDVRMGVLEHRSQEDDGTSGCFLNCYDGDYGAPQEWTLAYSVAQTYIDETGATTVEWRDTYAPANYEGGLYASYDSAGLELNAETAGVPSWTSDWWRSCGRLPIVASIAAIPGGLLSGELPVDGRSDIWEVSVAAGDTLEVSVSPADTSEKLIFLALVGSDGCEVANQDGVCRASASDCPTIRWIATSTGTVRIGVAGESGGSAAWHYALTVHVNGGDVPAEQVGDDVDMGGVERSSWTTGNASFTWDSL